MSDEFEDMLDVAALNARQDLRGVLVAIAKLDPSNPAHGPEADYDSRNVLVVQAVHLAMLAGMPAGFGVDASEPLYVVAYIELYEPPRPGFPSFGQVSWHIPAHQHPYDGHDTPGKYRRISEYSTAGIILREVTREKLATDFTLDPGKPIPLHGEYL